MNTVTLSLAPIRGITDRIYRDAFHQHFGGFDYAVSPFISVTKGDKVTRKLLREFAHPDQGMRTVPQILSNDAEDFVPLATALHGLGYTSVNWNLGCPFPKVVNKARGSGLLPYPPKIERVLERACASSPCRISVKLRLGFDDPEEILNLVPILNRYPLDEVIIHPRTGVQQYTGRCDHASFAHAASLLRHPVVYNGDINSLAEYRRLAELFPGISRWMIGRGALADPYLPQAIRTGTEPTDIEKRAALHRFHDDLYTRYAALMESPAHLLDRMKAEWEYFARLFPDGDKRYKKIRKITNRHKYEETVAKFFAEADAPES